MKLSIITVCLNEKDVENTCKSVTEQTFQDFEWIVVDGGSNQETLDILNKYKDRMNFFISEKDTGIYNAMNKGIKIAQGEYLHFLNAGDIYFANNTLELFENELSGEDIIAGNGVFLHADRTEIQVPKAKYVSKDFLKRNFCHQQVFMKRQLFDKYGMYNENYKIVSDWEKWLLMFKDEDTTFKRVNETVNIFKMDGISSTNTELHEKERETVVKQYYPKYIYKRNKEYIRFFNITLMRIDKKGYKTTYYLFGFLPIFVVEIKE